MTRPAPRSLACSLPRLALLLVVLTPAVPAAPPDGYAFLPFDEALRRAAAEDRRVFLYVGREGCPTCDQTNRESLADPTLRELLQREYLVSYVDAEGGGRLTLPTGERVTEMDLNALLGVIGTPTFFFLEPDGSAILKRPGFQSVADFRLYDRFVREGHYRTQTLAQFRDATQ
jgi:thioredoxin-related protein